MLFDDGALLITSKYVHNLLKKSRWCQLLSAMISLLDMALSALCSCEESTTRNIEKTRTLCRYLLLSLNRTGGPDDIILKIENSVFVKAEPNDIFNQDIRIFSP